MLIFHIVCYLYRVDKDWIEEIGGGVGINEFGVTLLLLRFLFLVFRGRRGAVVFGLKF